MTRCTFTCRFCAATMRCTPTAYQENPFCSLCLDDRLAMAGSIDPLIEWRSIGGYDIPIRLSDVAATKGEQVTAVLTPEDCAMIRRAQTYACDAHEATNHTYGGRPYAVHLRMVVGFVHRFSHLIPEGQHALAVAGAWVHDVIEDARQTYSDVSRATSPEIAELAFALTNEKGRTRAERANDRYYEGIRANPIYVFVKLCDRLANVAFSRMQQHQGYSGSMLSKYRREQAEFVAQLFDARFEPMWIELGLMLTEVRA